MVEVKPRKLKSKFTSNGFVLKLLESFFGRGSFIIFTLLFSFVCTRLYGAEVFGKFTYAFTLIQVIMIIAKAGLDKGLIYSIPQNQYKHVSLSFLVNLIVSTTLIVVGWVFIDDIYIKFMLPLIWLISTEQLFFGMYRSDRKIKEYYFINGFLTMILRIALIICFYYLTGKSEFSIAFAVYFSFVFSNVMYLFHNKKKFNKLNYDKDFLKYSFTLVLAGVMGALISKADLLMLGNMTTKTDVGVYQITVQISNVSSSLLLIFNTVFAPEISKLFYEQKIDQLKSLYLKVTRVLTVLSFVITFVLIIGSSLILQVFGSEFIEGQSALIYRSLGQFVNVAVGGVWLMLSMTGEPRFQFYANVIAIIINVLFNLLLIPIYGINGAAFASMITIIFTNVMGYVIVSKRFNIKVFKFF